MTWCLIVNSNLSYGTMWFFTEWGIQKCKKDFDFLEWFELWSQKKTTNYLILQFKFKKYKKLYDSPTRRIINNIDLDVMYNHAIKNFKNNRKV